jgi:hypothetical protein
VIAPAVMETMTLVMRAPWLLVASVLPASGGALRIGRSPAGLSRCTLRARRGGLWGSVRGCGAVSAPLVPLRLAATLATDLRAAASQREAPPSCELPDTACRNGSDTAPAPYAV